MTVSAITVVSEWHKVYFWINGIGDVGKITACAIVANNKRVREKFSEGVLWMELGMYSSAERVLEGVMSIVESSGGLLIT